MLRDYSGQSIGGRGERRWKKGKEGERMREGRMERGGGRKGRRGKGCGEQKLEVKV